MIQLGVNIDHIATIRQARHSFEPNPIFAVQEATLGGANSITIHLREDERHITYRDAKLIKQVIPTKLNLEMSLNDDVIKKAITLQPHQITIVPEKREEITTESGLNVQQNLKKLQSVIKDFKDIHSVVSLFIDADKQMIELSKEVGADCVEIHTGPYANAIHNVNDEFQKILNASFICKSLDLGFYAGHGLNYQNIYPFLTIPNLREVNIGHSIIARSVFVGLRQAVKDMKEILQGTD